MSEGPGYPGTRFDTWGEQMFGKKREGKAKKRYTTSPAQRQRINKINRILVEQLGKGVEPYSGDLAAEASPLQQGLFNVLEQQSGGEGGSLEQVLSKGQQLATQEQEPYDQEAARNYWQQAFVEPTRQNFYEETMPQLREKFAGQGALSSGGLNRALADAAAEMNTRLGGKLGELVYQGRQDYLDRQLRERETGLSMLDQALNEASALSQAGATQRSIEQQGLEGAFKKWQQSRPYNNPWLSYMGNRGTLQQPFDWQMWNTKPYEGALSMSSSSFNRAFGKSFGSSMGQGLGGMAGGGMSDRRLKQDIQYLDPITVDGKQIYPVSFAWKDDPGEEHIGVIAQDLQKTHPELVFEKELEGESYLAVDYPSLRQRIETVIEGEV